MAKQVIVNDDQKPHFVLVPFLATGHMIPMVDLACLIADRGALVTFITTPVNAARIRHVIDRVKADGLPIRFVELEFPCGEGGLPIGCENVDLVPSKDLFKPFFDTIGLLRQPLELYLREVKPVPSCMIVDYSNSFTADVGRELSIPRIIFHGPSCFYILCYHNILKHKVHDGADEFEPIVVPGLPQQIQVSRAQAPGWFPGPYLKDIREKAIEAEASADGIVINTFYELESEFVQRYREAIGKPVWPIGPFSLYNKDVTSKATRGKKSSIDEHQVLSWLDSMEPKSTIFINFGSLVHMKASQLIELGRGLEASEERPFIWVIKEGEKCPEFEKWMFEERTKERSLIITGWAPQVVILSHPSIGGFITHCGWNSTLEAICAGVPMITWPHFADQFLNEKLVVQVLKIGVAIGVKVPVHFVRAEEDEVLVKREDVEKVISSLMDVGEEGHERRLRAAEFAENARKAMEQEGSSYQNLSLLTEYIMESSKEA